MADLVVVIPSRGRPERAAELAETCRTLCCGPTALLICVDIDDPTLPEYRRLTAGPMTTVYAVKPAGHVGAINAGAHRALTGWHPYAVAKLDDDHRPRTHGWDRQYLTALRQLGTGVVYGNDLLQGERLPTAPAMTADIVQALGYMAPPSLRHLYCDDFWRDLGQGAGCLRYLPGVVVEHMHPAAGKAPIDAGYERANSGQRWSEDGAAYRRYRAERLAADVAAVRALRSVRA